MALHPDFPTSPYEVALPETRWYPGDEALGELGYERLLPPLVHKIRRGVQAWRASGYEGASDTSRLLLKYWFGERHAYIDDEGIERDFRFYFAQQEAVEAVVWLYEVERARDPYSLIRYDSSGYVSKALFDENWTRYCVKMATGSGKTKVMTLLMAWSYFHCHYEADSDLSKNFLLVAPNIIVLDRLYRDFRGLRAFYDGFVLPSNGWGGRNWTAEFDVRLHVQDDIKTISESGNLFLTNIHRVYEGKGEPSLEDADLTDYFLGSKPVGRTTDSRVDLGQVIRDIPDLLVLNDEAHHVWDRDLAWFKSIQDISDRLLLKGGRLSAQLDFTATPKNRETGAIFVQTVCDYPLVEAIRQGVVKTPVLPDGASRARLVEKQSDVFTERYEDYIHLGYLEWRKVYDELEPAGKKSILFVMTEDTKNCDEVGAYLEQRYPELQDAVLVIHTKNNGEVSEAGSGKSKEELEVLRRAASGIDGWDSPYKAVVSVMVLREGWDVQNVVSIVGLRKYSADNRILPEQTLGRGLRRMFRGQPVVEKVSVIGTEAFMDFVESIKVEGVEFATAPMGEHTRPKSPLVVEVDDDKDIEALDIEMPVLEPRVMREYKNLAEIDVAAIPVPRLAVHDFTKEEQRDIVFKDIDTEQVSHVTRLDTSVAPTSQAAIGYFTRTILRDLRLVGGFDVLFGMVKDYIESMLFESTVDLDDLNILRNLSRPEATKAVFEGFKGAINDLTIRDRGTAELKDHIKLSKARPAVVSDQPYFLPKKSLFTKMVGDSKLELDFAAALDGYDDIISWAKNMMSTGFRIEYQATAGGIANYYPDFLVKRTESDIWVIETKGLEDTDVPRKWRRLVQWCDDATSKGEGVTYRAMYVLGDKFDRYKPKAFASLIETFGSETPSDVE